MVGLHDYSDENCSTEFPYSYESLHALEGWRIVMVSVTCVLTFFVCCIFIEELVFLFRHYGNDWKSVRTKTWLLGLFPVFALTSMIAILVPRSGQLDSFVSAVYLSICLMHFLNLMILYLGGEERMCQTLIDVDVPLQSPPLTCCICCMPKVKLNKRNLLWMKICVWQVVFLRPFLMFISAVLWTNGQYNPHELTPYSPYAYMVSIGGISTLFAMYGLILVFRITRKHLSQMKIKHKFASIQLMLICSNLQPVIISLLARLSLINCTVIYSREAQAEMITNVLLIVEVFILSMYAWYNYHHLPLIDMPDSLENRTLVDTSSRSIGGEYKQTDYNSINGKNNQADCYSNDAECKHTNYNSINQL